MGIQTTVATLMYVTSAVILACVVDYAVVTFEQTLDTEDIPQIDRIQKMEDIILNQTDNVFSELESYNQTQIQPIEQILP